MYAVLDAEDRVRELTESIAKREDHAVQKSRTEPKSSLACGVRKSRGLVAV
jgi:hypothetical protein